MVNKRCVDDVRDSRQEDAMVFIKKRGGNGIEFTRPGGCTVDYFKDTFISDWLKSWQGISSERGIRESSWVWRRKIVSDGADFLSEVIRKDIRKVVRVKC